MRSPAADQTPGWTWRLAGCCLALAALIALLAVHGLPEQPELELALDPCAVFTCRTF